MTELTWGEGCVPIPKDEWRYLLMFKPDRVELAVFCQDNPDGSEGYPKFFDLRDLPNEFLTLEDLVGLGFASASSHSLAVCELPIGPLL